MRETRNAKITGTFLGFEDHGCFTAFVNLDYGGSGQGFGGYFLNGPVCWRWIAGVLETVGVSSWEELKGKHCRADFETAKVHRIGHLLEDRWFDPAELDWTKEGVG